MADRTWGGFASRRSRRPERRPRRRRNDQRRFKILLESSLGFVANFPGRAGRGHFRGRFRNGRKLVLHSQQEQGWWGLSNNAENLT